ncbi:MAG: shikimate dehydrogenase, partial [Pseudarthrobacter sp.]|nr:shikimate dehydrogenase [Pseudarthrobacter sp.]
MSIRTESYLVGLVGDGVTPSLTPPMHEREGDVQGLRYLYRPIDLLELGVGGEAIGTILQSARTLGFNGLNITHPCKQLVLEHLDEISADARRLGAVNTVVIRDGRFIGHNTDFSGFAAALAAGLPGARLDRVVQLGAGGAGSAVAYALLTAGVQELDLVDMDPERAAARAADLAGFFPDRTVTARPTTELPQLMPLADGLVHCTPVGMAAHPVVPLDLDLLEARHWVADIVY